MVSLKFFVVVLCVFERDGLMLLVVDRSDHYYFGGFRAVRRGGLRLRLGERDICQRVRGTWRGG